MDFNGWSLHSLVVEVTSNLALRSNGLCDNPKIAATTRIWTETVDADPKEDQTICFSWLNCAVGTISHNRTRIKRLEFHRSE